MRELLGYGADDPPQPYHRWPLGGSASIGKVHGSRYLNAYGSCYPCFNGSVVCCWLWGWRWIWLFGECLRRKNCLVNFHILLLWDSFSNNRRRCNLLLCWLFFCWRWQRRRHGKRRKWC